MTEREFGIIVAIFFGITAFFITYRFVVNGMTLYQQSFIRRVGTGLKDSFIFLNPRILFFLNIAILLISAVTGFYTFGVLGMIFSVIIVAAIPVIFLNIIHKRRAKRFVYQLPDSLNAIASSLRAGSNLARAMEQVATQQSAPISQEFAVVLSEYKVGKDFEESLADMQKRINKPEVLLLNSAIGISRSVGGNLADTLETLSSTLREKAKVEGKIDALTSMGRMQGWVVGAMPLFIIAMLFKQEPDAMNSLFTETIGWLTLGVIIMMMILAAIMIRKIVNIDV